MKIVLVISFFMLVSCQSNSTKVEIHPRDINKIESYDVIHIGQDYGTKEIPQLAFELAANFAKIYGDEKILLGIEVPKIEQSHIDEFMKSGETEVLKASQYFTQESMQTKVSKALIQGLRSLRKYKNIIVKCIDEPIPHSQQRSYFMASVFSKAYKEVAPKKAITLTGNDQAKVGSQISSYKKNYSFAEHLRKNKKLNLPTDKIISLTTLFEKGRVWACNRFGEKKCSEGEVQGQKVMLYKNERLQLSKGLVPGYDGFYYFDKVSASKPWRKSR